jgi:PilZ domain
MSQGPGVKEKKSDQPTERTDKRVHVALPIRITYWDKDKKPGVEMACTYDISSRGARITNLRCVKGVGEVVAVERGRNKSFCRVVWMGEEGTEVRGQIGLQTVDRDRSMWEGELKEMEEVFDPIGKDVGKNQVTTSRGGNRRRHGRFQVEGAVELVKASGKTSRAGGKVTPTKAVLKDLSEVGCLVKTKEVLIPGTDLKLVLRIANYDVTLKGQVRHSLDMGVGIEFSEIRKGDRETLKHLLRKLSEKQLEETIEVVVTP